MFLRYWNNEKATREKFVGDWALTGDLARKDADGYFWFVGRKDDLISSGGYRIGPSEIEDCLQGHPAVALAAAIGAPDPVRGEVVKAFVQLHAGVAGNARAGARAPDLCARVLSAHEYPREIEFIEAMPGDDDGQGEAGRPEAARATRRRLET